MLLSYLWENQLQLPESFKYISLSAEDNGPVCPSASEQHKHNHTKTYTQTYQCSDV